MYSMMLWVVWFKRSPDLETLLSVFVTLKTHLTQKRQEGMLRIHSNFPQPLPYLIRLLMKNLRAKGQKVKVIEVIVYVILTCKLPGSYSSYWTVENMYIKLILSSFQWCIAWPCILLIFKNKKYFWLFPYLYWWRHL